GWYLLYLTVVGGNVQSEADVSPRSCTFPAEVHRVRRTRATPAQGRWGDSNRIAPGSAPVVRDESAAVVAKQQYPTEQLPLPG
ncbi:MAG: hypothetical protein JXA30_04630, partial [Deltaproteobacteria bacterium]|nr:hypothetical protein [Deltaproteobacteria bacterium]